MLEWLWKRQQSNDIAILKLYNKDSSPWGGEAILFSVENGIGSLKTVYGFAKDKTWKSFLLLSNIPLVKWHSEDEYNCPTCEKLISAGYGLSHVDEDTIQTIRSHTNQSYEGIEKAFEELKPILKLLPDGCYALADIELFPVDGSGNFFWDQSNMPRRNKATCATGYRYRWLGGWPAFLLPSQLPDRYNKATVDFYREKYRNEDGKKLRGIAFHMEAFLSVLLDGHHKAVAAAIEEREFRCLTILPVTACFSSLSATDKTVWIGGIQLAVEDLPKRFCEHIIKNFGKHSRLSAQETDRCLDLEASCWNDAIWPEELTKIGERYPDTLGLACIKIAGDLSNERIDRLLKGGEREWAENLDFVLRALIALKDPRATKLALRIGRNGGLKEMWDVAFKHLATTQSEEIEDFFINFLIEDDKRHLSLTKVADEYLMQRS